MSSFLYHICVILFTLSYSHYASNKCFCWRVVYLKIYQHFARNVDFYIYSKVLKLANNSYIYNIS